MFSSMLRLPVGVLVLSLCMGLGTSAATIAVAITSLAGEAIASHPSLATVPYGLQFLALMASAVPPTLEPLAALPKGAPLGLPALCPQACPQAASSSGG